MAEIKKRLKFSSALLTAWILLMELLLLYGIGSGVTSHDPYGIGMVLIVCPIILGLIVVHLVIYLLLKKSPAEKNRLVSKYLFVGHLVIWTILFIVAYSGILDEF